ncbi:MAG: peroxiredoxin [Candidatus Gracilibacteria bacterium]|nr:peroxiredoxin [Candidatus Gracilibacteria bacterium]
MENFDFYDAPRIPLLGEDAPAFKCASTTGPLDFPTDYEGKWVVLFSHPADFTPVCTTEFIGFQEKKSEFDKRNTELIGYSVDGIQSHIAWVRNIKEKFNVDITFPIAAHPSIAVNYGMMQPSADDSHTVRAVFVINPKGKIAAIMYYPLANGRSIDEILRLVDSLQMTANHGRATPANWPNNTIFGSDVIVPPASTVKEAEENPKKYESKDWYLCTEKMPK